jgi:hypothetical protein
MSSQEQTPSLKERLGVATGNESDCSGKPLIMRAKMKVADMSITETSDRVHMLAVSKPEGYPADGSDEDNTFALWTPQGELTITINNPALLGKLRPGKKLYLDFYEAD